MYRSSRYHRNPLASLNWLISKRPLLSKSYSPLYFYISKCPGRYLQQRALVSPQWTSRPRNFPSSGFKLLDSCLRIEEETLPTYQARKYYPVQQGEVLNNRYQVLAKLGYGVTSTVWFGRDLV